MHMLAYQTAQHVRLMALWVIDPQIKAESQHFTPRDQHHFYFK